MFLETRTKSYYWINWMLLLFPGPFMFLHLLIYQGRNSERLPRPEVQEYERFLQFERDTKLLFTIVVCSSTFLLILPLNFVINFYCFHAFLCLNKWIKGFAQYCVKMFLFSHFLKWFMGHKMNLHKSRDMKHNWYFNVFLQVVKILRK